MLAIANTKPETAWEDEFHNFILLCRRLAVKHPLLILRYKISIVSLLRMIKALSNLVFYELPIRTSLVVLLFLGPPAAFSSRV